jgi:hypothetical protein
MDTAVTSILQQLRALEELVTHHGLTTDELHRLEVELSTIIERIDSIRTLARDLKHIPNLTAENTKGAGQVRGDAEGLRSRKTVVIKADYLHSAGVELNHDCCRDAGNQRLRGCTLTVAHGWYARPVRFSGSYGFSL